MIPASFGCISNCRFCPYPLPSTSLRRGITALNSLPFTNVVTVLSLRLRQFEMRPKRNVTHFPKTVSQTNIIKFCQNEAANRNCRFFYLKLLNEIYVSNNLFTFCILFKSAGSRVAELRQALCVHDKRRAGYDLGDQPCSQQPAGIYTIHPAAAC